MKAGRGHRVPLSERALAVLTEAGREADGATWCSARRRAGRCQHRRWRSCCRNSTSTPCHTAFGQAFGTERQSARIRPERCANWRWRRSTATGWKRPAGAATCSRSGARCWPTGRPTSRQPAGERATAPAAFGVDRLNRAKWIVATRRNERCRSGPLSGRGPLGITGAMRRPRRRTQVPGASRRPGVNGNRRASRSLPAHSGRARPWPMRHRTAGLRASSGCRWQRDRSSIRTQWPRCEWCRTSGGGGFRRLLDKQIKDQQRNGQRTPERQCDELTGLPSVSVHGFLSLLERGFDRPASRCFSASKRPALPSVQCRPADCRRRESTDFVVGAIRSSNPTSPTLRAIPAIRSPHRSMGRVPKTRYPVTPVSTSPVIESSLHRQKMRGGVRLGRSNDAPPSEVERLFA